MPLARNLRRVVLVWLFRARALRCCWPVIFFVVFATSRSEAAWSLSHHDRIKIAIAVCNWHTVNSGFSPPFLPHLGQKQVTHRRQKQVSFQSQVASSLVLIQANFALLIL